MDATTRYRNESTRDLKRCPVFKIDLKGRFVNIDDLTAEMLGLPVEGLFGRNIKEYLIKESYNGLFEIIRFGSHFNSCYESINLVFIDHFKNLHRYKAVVSLNFIAGNPANYQIILTFRDKSEVIKNDKSDDFYKQLDELSGDFVRNPDWKKLTEILLGREDIKQVGVYGFDRSSLTLLGDSSQKTNEYIMDLAQANESHELVVISGKPSISFHEKNNLYEYSFPLKFNEFIWGLLRIFSLNDSVEWKINLGEVSDYLGDTFCIHALIGYKKSDNEINNKIDFTALLKRLGCSYISFSNDGAILPSDSFLAGQALSFAECRNNIEFEEKLRTCTIIPVPSDDCPELIFESKQAITFPVSGIIECESKQYYYKMLESGKMFGSGAVNTIVIFPGIDKVKSAGEEELLNTFLDTAGIFLDPIKKCGRKLADQYYARLNRGGRFYIDTIRDNCRVLGDAVNRFKEIQKILSKKERPVQIDMTEIVDNIIKNVHDRKLKLQINFDNPDNISPVADPVRMAEFMKAIVNGLINKSLSLDKSSLAIKIISENDRCRLLYEYNGELEKDFDFKTVMQPLTTIREMQQINLTVFEHELPIAKLLIESMGGSIEIMQNDNHEVVLQVDLPFKK